MRTEEPVFVLKEFTIAILIVAFLGWAVAYPSDDASTQEDSKVTKAEDLSEEEVAEIKKDNDEINERNKQDEAMDNPERTEDERKQALADEVIKGDAGALSDLFNTAVEAYCDDPNGGKRILLGSYISQEGAAHAVSEQPDPTICYVE